mgnify:CR=1 FL=1
MKDIEARGWKYRVMAGICDNSFKGRYLQPNGHGWKCMRALPWRKTEEEAQSDLDAYAKKKGWMKI